MQGAPQVEALDKALYIKWNTLYGYKPRSDDNDEIGFRPGKPRDGDWIERDRLGRKPMLWAAEIYEHVWQVLTDENVVSLFKWDPKRWLSEKYFEFVMEEALGIGWKIDNHLNSVCQTRDGLGTPNGRYIWLGGERGGKPCTSRLNLETEAKGMPLKAWGGDVPMETGSTKGLSTTSDDYATMIFCGLIHAFERQERYQEECAIRAAILQDVTKGNLDLEVLMNANARCGIHPRMSSTLSYGGDIFPAVKGLVALHYAWKWITQQVSPMWGSPTCSVRFMVPEITASQALAEEIQYFFKSVYDYTDDPRTSTSTGNCFFPSNNAPDARPFKIGFAKAATSKDDVMVCIPQILESRTLEFSNEPIRVTNRGVLNIPTDKQNAYMRYPVEFDPTRDFTDREEWLGHYGRTRITRTITDHMDFMPQLGSWAPSVLIRAMCIGWPITTDTKFQISNDPDCPSHLTDFSDFAFDLAGQRITGQKGTAIVPYKGGGPIVPI
jgi:hypothetical protein